MKEETINIENINVPGKTTRVNAAKYQAMRSALLKVIPENGEGVTHKEMAELSKPYLPDALFPGGAKSMWWSKTVQLDLEAKGLLTRKTTKPLRWVKV